RRWAGWAATAVRWWPDMRSDWPKRSVSPTRPRPTTRRSRWGSCWRSCSCGRAACSGRMACGRFETMSDSDWRSLVDLARLADWMSSQGLESGQIEDATPLTGGTQNILLRFRRGAREFVLRRPPAHPVVDGSQTMRREARVLGALRDTQVPHPRLIAACDYRA